MNWTAKDRVLSVSADGRIIQWDATSGQSVSTRPAHPIGISSLSVNPQGTQVLYNSLEGLTTLWDAESGDVLGTHESFARTTEGSEPGSFALPVIDSNTPC